MRSVLSGKWQIAGWSLPALVIMGVLFCFCTTAVTADDGYTDGAPLGAPNWILERMDTSIMPDYYLPPNTTSDEVRVPTATSYINSGNTLLTSGSFAEAKGAFENAINMKSDTYDAWVGRALALEGLKRYQTSEESYRKAISLAAADGSAWVAHAGVGRVLIELKKYEDAAASLETAIDEYAKSGSTNIDDLASIYNHLAEAKNKLGLADEAAAAKEKASSLKSKTATVFKGNSS
ncbi:MAG: tetratricopeptide repeat protein [Methanospirillum sp.]|uniref:tetratricopeptide repeat protein n=1 Tax=Methanospirillum sp. TaxID=45200 RepID=UPI00236C4153|nr:tetratricopeptide repeat protein [Methanospirillum sp.]MDD1728901.1 tetratricopeptide repeat protein [Methanospirillum sp.]